jgi:CDP-glycerol glycerophosphotransferase
MQENLAVYTACGATAYAGNPAAIYERARQDAPGIRGVWIIRADYTDRIPAGVEFVENGSKAYYRLMARAKYVVTDDDVPDEIAKRPGQVFVQTHQGTPLQATGIGLRDYPIAAAGIDFERMLRRSDRWDYSLSSNRFSTDVWERAFPGSFLSLEYGYPRNDRLLRADDAEYRRQRERLGIADSATAVLYAPTSRPWTGEVSDPPVDLATLGEKLGDGWSVLLRRHGTSGKSARLEELEQRGLVRDVTDHPAVEDLMIAADVLITDYSSIMADYALLDRPIVLYADDWQTYRRVRGTTVDLPAYPPGAVETTIDGLVDALLSGRFRGADATRLRAQFRARLGAFDDGHAAERVVRRVFLGQNP